MRVPLVYKPAPLFGFDIGSRSIKVVQIHGSGRHRRVAGYGHVNFPPDAVVEGIISDPEAIAKVVAPLLSHPQAGGISSRRAVVALPTAKVFIRTLQLPNMSAADLEQAIHFEAEQYVPVPINDLYIDYEVIATNQKVPLKAPQPEPTKTKSDAGKPQTPPSVAVEQPAEVHNEILMVAAPRAIVDSYIKLFDLLKLELGAIETGLSALTRALTPSSKDALLVIDFGAHSADMAVFDQVIRLTGTLPIGGDELTGILVKALGITADQADEIKYKFGIGPSGLQTKITAALDPSFKTIIAEAKKILKFYQDRSLSQANVAGILLTGGSASMPGLAQMIGQELGLPVAIGNPWGNLDLGHLPMPSKIEAPMYATAIGLGLRTEA